MPYLQTLMCVNPAPHKPTQMGRRFFAHRRIETVVSTLNMLPAVCAAAALGDGAGESQQNHEKAMRLGQKGFLLGKNGRERRDRFVEHCACLADPAYGSASLKFWNNACRGVGNVLTMGA